MTQQINIRETLGAIKELKEIFDAPIFGESYEDEDDYRDEVRDPVEPYGEIHFDDDGDVDISVDEAIFGEPYQQRYNSDSEPAYGGIMDDVRRLVTSHTRSVVNSLTGNLSGQIRSVKKQTSANRRVINSLAQQQKYLARNMRKTKSVAMKGTRNLLINAGLSAAAALPGIKAYKRQGSVEQTAEFEAREALSEALNDLTIPTALTQASLTAQGGSYDATALNNSFDDLKDKQAEMITVINQLMTELADVKAKAETHAASVGKAKKIYVANSVIDLMSLLPGQWANEKQALYEFIMKWVFGQSSSNGSGASFNLSF